MLLNERGKAHNILSRKKKEDTNQYKKMVSSNQNVLIAILERWRV